MCFKTVPIKIFQTKYFRHDKGFFCCTCNWWQGTTSLLLSFLILYYFFVIVVSEFFEFFSDDETRLNGILHDKMVRAKDLMRAKGGVFALNNAMGPAVDSAAQKDGNQSSNVTSGSFNAGEGRGDFFPSWLSIHNPATWASAWCLRKKFLSSQGVLLFTAESYSVINYYKKRIITKKVWLKKQNNYKKGKNFFANID